MADREHVRHEHIRVVTHSGDFITTTGCMVQRLDDEEIVNGQVPDDLPEGECDENWRGGCPVE